MPTSFGITYARALDIIKSMDEYQRAAFFYAAETIQNGGDYDPKHKIRLKFLGKAKRFRDIYDTYNEEQQDMFIYITSKLISQRSEGNNNGTDTGDLKKD